MTLQLRAALPADIETLLPMVRASRACEGLGWDELLMRAALVGLMVRRAAGTVWLLEEGGTAVGYMIVTLGYTLEFSGCGALVDELYVVPAHRGRGFGRRALEVAEAYCRLHEAHTLHAIVRGDNAPALRAAGRYRFVVSERVLLTRAVHLRDNAAASSPSPQGSAP
jgi:diamine N-acetyltransferase